MRHRKETCGWHVCAGRVKHVVDLDLTVARIGPHDEGARRAAKAPGGPEVGHHAPERITIKYNTWGEAFRQNAEREGKARGLRWYPSQIPTPRPLARACAAPREWTRGTGRCVRGGRAPRRGNRPRRPPAAGEIR